MAVLDAAIDAGVTFLDTADMYGGSPASARRSWARRCRAGATRSCSPRSSATPGATWATALGAPRPRGRTSGARSRRRSRRLQTDWIDLYQLHVPDPQTPIEETLDVLDDLVREGKVRYIGHSNLAGWQIAEAHYVAARARGIPFVSAQNHYSLLARGGRARGAAGGRAVRARLLPVLPAAQRPADRQVHARRRVRRTAGS